ncbi:ATP-dependent DNA helicase yku80 [Paramarasmius palmivorus]|uniref:ATP-dependent DNA helicase II subunit 2 n=1 Tax=Paramarasmius palmivorus TaxID=297713 RepID=A0AAW0E1C8_9AGAR
MAERAGYTITMFVVDVSKEMGNLRTVELPEGPNGEQRTAEITNLEWGLQFVKLKIQEMIYNGRKTEQCGVIIFGSEETDNIINDTDGGYENVMEYIPIGTPNAGTLAKLDQLTASDTYGDPLDAIIVGIETQQRYLEKKKWTRKLYMVTGGEAQIELEDWEMTADKMNQYGIKTAIVGVDFDQDDEDYHFIEENKSREKRENERFFHQFCERLENGNIGTLAFVMQEVARPDVKITRSTLSPTILRLGDVDNNPEEALEIIVKTSKCTAVTRPKGFKKFAIHRKKDENGKLRDVDEDGYVTYVQLKQKTDYYLDKEQLDKDGDVTMDEPEVEPVKEEVDEDEEEDEEMKKWKTMEKIDKEQLIRGFKYGTSYAPCPDGQFPRLPTKKGIDICGFFLAENFKRELSMSEIQYVWGDPNNAQQQSALSSLAQAMSVDDTAGDEDSKMNVDGDDKKKKRKPLMAIARWVTRDGMDPKMGVLAPTLFENVHCLLWAQMPFADDVRKYTFASLNRLVNKKGEVLTEHPYIPTDEQQEAMDDYVDAMDLMEAGPKDEEGNRTPWFSPVDSYNPALHRVKQALFHCAVVNDLETNPIPPPHPETTKYFEPPKRVLKASKEALDACKETFKVKHGTFLLLCHPPKAHYLIFKVQKAAKRTRQDGHQHARDDDDDVLLLDRKSKPRSQTISPSKDKGKEPAAAEDSETEDEDEEMLLLPVRPKAEDKEPSEPSRQPLPTPARSLSPPAKRAPKLRSKRDPDPDIDRGIAPGRIIGTAYPLADFEDNIKTGDVVTKAVEDLAAVIEEIVTKPFSSRRTDEMIECMVTLRNTALTEDEIDAWNEFIERLHDKCVNSKPGNMEFWDAVRKIGVELSYITDEEAKKVGGSSDKTTNDAAELMG